MILLTLGVTHSFVSLYPQSYLQHPLLIQTHIMCPNYYYKALDVVLQEPDMEVSTKQDGAKRFDDPGVAAALAGDSEVEGASGGGVTVSTRVRSGKMEPKVRYLLCRWVFVLFEGSWSTVDAHLKGSAIVDEPAVCSLAWWALLQVQLIASLIHHGHRAKHLRHRLDGAL